MTEYQKETAFLKDLILFDDTDESHRLDERVEQAQCDERCIQRAIWLMALFAVVAGTGFAYGTIMQGDFPYYEPRFATVICEVGLASLTCLAIFAGLLRSYRNKLNRLREECRQLCMKRLEPHPLQSHQSSFRSGQLGAGEREVVSGTMNVNGFAVGPNRMQLQTGSEQI